MAVGRQRPLLPARGCQRPSQNRANTLALGRRLGSRGSEVRAGRVSTWGCTSLGTGCMGLGPDVRWLLDSRHVRDSSEREEELPTSNSSAKPCLAPSKVARHLLGWAGPSLPPSLLLSGNPPVSCPNSPQHAAWRAAHAPHEDNGASGGLGSQVYLEPLTTSLQGGWAPRKERISCWARRPLGSGFGEQRIEVRGCLGCRTGGGVSCQGHTGSSPKGSRGDAAVLVACRWPKWARVPSPRLPGRRSHQEEAPSQGCPAHRPPRGTLTRPSPR